MAKKDYKINPERKAIKEKAASISQTKQDLKEHTTVAIIDLKKLPDSLLQSLRKKLRDKKSQVRVLKKAIIERALAGNKKLEPMISDLERPVALIFTDMSPYEINKMFKENRKKMPAKPGDTAPIDIVVPAGETDLPPGPALSELKNAGINVQIKAGKITVVKDSIVVKKGEQITLQKAKALQTLNIMPFEAMANLSSAFDGQYIYTKEILDLDETLNQDLGHELGNAFNLSLNTGYPTKQTIGFMLSEAFLQSMNISLNGILYSSITIEQLLSSAAAQGMALSGLGAPVSEAAAGQAKGEGK